MFRIRIDLLQCCEKFPNAGGGCGCGGHTCAVCYSVSQPSVGRMTDARMNDANHVRILRLNSAKAECRCHVQNVRIGNGDTMMECGPQTDKHVLGLCCQALILLAVDQSIHRQHAATKASTIPPQRGVRTRSNIFMQNR